MLRKPLTHLLLILGLIALWFAVSAKDAPQPKIEVTKAEVTKPEVTQTQTQTQTLPTPVPEEPVAAADPDGVELDLPSEDVRVVQEGGPTALLHIDMKKHKRMALELQFSGPSVEWSFNLGDSNTNNGWGGDSMTARNDAEIQILNGNLEVYGSDLLDHYKEYPPKQRFMKRWDNVAGDGRTVRLEIADGEVTYINEEGQRESYLHPALFALSGQDDPEAGVNYDLYLGVNRVVVGGRNGSGLAKVKLQFLD